MKNEMNLYALLNMIKNILDEEEFPEVCRVIDEESENKDLPIGEAPRIASRIMECDKPKQFPQELIDFVKGLYEIGIAAGDAGAMNDLGAQYYDGHRGFEQSFSKAVELYKMAAANGDRQAQENLGYCYYYGRDMEPDYEKAFHYFALGAFDGHIVSLYKIGDMYLNGYYVEKNEREAFEIYMRCLDTMTDEAAPKVAGPVYLRLGKMFLRGLGTEKKLESALICYQKAESYLYSMVLDEDVMYRNSLMAAIKGQEEVRKEMLKQLPEDEWKFD